MYNPVPFCKLSMLYFCIFLWMLDSNVEHPEVVSSLDLWDFESAHVVCASLVETWRRLITHFGPEKCQPMIGGG